MTKKGNPVWRKAAGRYPDVSEIDDYTREIATASKIQQSLLPDVPPDMRGVRMACRSIPAHVVGGDYFDFFRWDESSLDLVIADVSGHNLGSALIMVETRSVLRAHAFRSGNAGDALAVLNELLYDDLTRAELFISMFYAKFSAETRLLTYANGGHNPPLLLRCGQQGYRGLDADGMVLGVLKGVEFEEKNIFLREGDVLTFYTDGITESQNDSGELFGAERLYQALYAYRGTPPEAIIEGVLKHVHDFSGHKALQDDISLVVMKID
ncbi:MAG: serine/threonine-protein phosphatase [Geobacter sp.]|nr:MAG: serine/threonine-protein phosphatase [Geobacter sp.]